MEQQYSYCLYKVQLEKWYQSIKNGSPVQEYTPTFLHQSQIHHQLHITFDNKIATIINFLILHSEFHQYQQKILLAIANELYQVKFIDKRHLRYIEQQKKSTMGKKIVKFFENIELLKQSNHLEKLQPQMIADEWEEQTKVQLETFWILVVVSDFKYHLLYQLYYQVDECKGVKDNVDLYNYVISIGIIQSPQKKVHEQNNQPEKLEKSSEINDVKVQKENLSTNTSEKIQNQVPEPPKTSPKKSKPYQYMNIYMVAYLQSPKNNKVDDYLVKKAYRNSLFFNKKFNLILEQIQMFLDYARGNLLIDSNYKMEVFGSLRSKFALRNQYDIDITFVHKDGKQPERQCAVNLLENIQTRIYHALFHPSWIRNTRLYSFVKMPLPVLKIEVNQQEFLNSFGIQNIDKIDVTIGNATAAINSQLLQHYAKVPEIQLFIMNVKYWAKKVNVINGQRPMEGLSGYAVVLMCLFYLMDTKQIKFLNLTQDQINNIQIGSVKPDLSGIKILPLAENFLKFLQYYHEYGYFQREKKIACLLKKCEKARQLWNEDFVINMYDFIDNTNPGRLDMKMKSMLFGNIERAYKIMLTKDLEVIKENLFTQVQFNCSLAKKRQRN